MRPAERVAEIVGPPFAGCVEQRKLKVEIGSTGSKQPLNQHHVEDLTRLYSPPVEVHELGTRSFLEVEKLILLNLQRGSAFVATGNGH